jgi:uncharacterized protein
MLALNLQKIRTAEEHVERVYRPDEVGAETDTYRVVQPVSLVFDVHKDRSTFRLSGRVKTRLELPCSRCLEPFDVDVDTPFDLRYEPQPTSAEQGEHELAEGDFDAASYTDDQIDLGQLIQERIYLALDMKPLCSDDCKGLCSNCGTNLNRGSCSCDTHWEDPRLTALRALKKES